MSVPTTGVDVPDQPVSGSTRRERVGWYFYDWANSAFSTTVIAVFLSLVVVDAVLIVATPFLLKSLIDDGIYPKNSGLVVRLSLLVAAITSTENGRASNSPRRCVAVV